jgi:succinyl-CoA synthetase beta subunit
MYQMFLKLDATQIEINPWAITPDKDIYCIDAKINLDDNALFRHPEVLEMHRKNASSADIDLNE